MYKFIDGQQQATAFVQHFTTKSCSKISAF